MSSRVLGAEMFCGIIISPQERWNHAQREAALLTGDLVVVELHGIDGAAAESVVLGVGPEDGREKYASVSSFVMHESAIRAVGNHNYLVEIAATEARLVLEMTEVLLRGLPN